MVIIYYLLVTVLSLFVCVVIELILRIVIGFFRVIGIFCEKIVLLSRSGKPDIATDEQQGDCQRPEKHDGSYFSAPIFSAWGRLRTGGLFRLSCHVRVGAGCVRIFRGGFRRRGFGVVGRDSIFRDGRILPIEMCRCRCCCCCCCCFPWSLEKEWI